jgi:hypothetical protein
MNNLIRLSLLLFTIISCSNNTDQNEQNNDTPLQIVDTLPPLQDSLPILSLTKEQDSIQALAQGIKDSLKQVVNLPKLEWDILADLSFENKLNDTLEAYIDYPVFGALPQAYSGLEVEINGFMIPVAETGNEEIFILSAFPYSQCFFCGQAGLESIIDIQLLKKPERKLKLDEKLSFKGKLRLNDADLNYLIYILDDAELIE